MIAALVGPAHFRSHFPMLGRTVHLASCSLGARSVELDAALATMLEEMALGAPWERFEAVAEEGRRRFASLIGALPTQVALVPNASTGAYQVASTMDWARRPVIVTAGAEFPSLAHIWLAQRARGAVVRYAGRANGLGAGYMDVIDSRTGLVSMPLVTYRDATRLPARRIVDAAHSAGSRVLVDAYQAVGVEPVDVDELGCDYLVAGSSKYLLGMPGAAYLYVRSPGSEHLLPQLTGWFARVDPFAFDPYRLDFPDQARRFETGTPTVPALYAANAGLALVGGLDLAAVAAHVRGLTERLAARLTAQGERLEAPPAAERGAHVAVRDPDPQALAERLRRRGIIVSPRGDVVRLSFHYYNSTDDADAACEEIARCRRAAVAPVLRGPRWRRELRAWLQGTDARAFPYNTVVEEYHRVGKHFVPPALLEALAEVRRVLPRKSGGDPATGRLERFLAVALDKHDGRYDYPTYLALDLLPLPTAEDVGAAAADRGRDLLLAGLVADALRFELDAADGRTELLPEMRPDPRTVAKRCRLGLQVMAPCELRLGLEARSAAGDPVQTARLNCAGVLEACGDELRIALGLSMLPVYVVHDEWMFVRVLQSFETVFARVAVQLQAAVTALGRDEAKAAARRVEAADTALQEAAPLFSLLATMQVEAFRTFRQYTEGASAIQSRGYKLIEAVCRTPDGPRLHSIAYYSVPEVRERVLAGQPTLDGTFAAARCGPAEREAVATAMARFARTLLQWRRTHYRLAVRMLGERTGTGYTEGTPYLGAVRSIPVFRSAGDDGG